MLGSYGTPFVNSTSCFNISGARLCFISMISVLCQILWSDDFVDVLVDGLGAGDAVGEELLGCCA